MHPAVYAALTDARESELRAARRYDTPARPVAEPRRRISLRVVLRGRRLARA